MSPCARCAPVWPGVVVAAQKWRGIYPGGPRARVARTRLAWHVGGGAGAARHIPWGATCARCAHPFRLAGDSGGGSPPSVVGFARRHWPQTTGASAPRTLSSKRPSQIAIRIKDAKLQINPGDTVAIVLPNHTNNQAGVAFAKAGVEEARRKGFIVGPIEVWFSDKTKIEF